MRTIRTAIRAAGLAAAVGCGWLSAEAAQVAAVVNPVDCSTGCSATSPGLITEGLDGALYTTMPTQYGGGGTVVAFPPDLPPGLNGPNVMNGVMTLFPVVFRLAGREGSSPRSGVTLGADGSLLGAATNGGPANVGAIFSISFANPATAAQTNQTAALTPLHLFGNGTDGAYPTAPPVQGRDGLLYGGTPSGNLYAVGPGGAGFTTLVTLGVPITAPLVVGEDGLFYGVTEGGGAYGFGTIFQWTPPGTPVVLYSFQGMADGGHPRGPLVWGRDGMLYGAAMMGGASTSQGVIYRQNPHVVNAYSVVHALAGAEGSTPIAGLVHGVDGRLYGAASAGGTNNVGTLFAVDAVSTALTPLFTFSSATGVNPFGSLTQHTNGKIYGTTTSGGSFGNGAYGVAFSIDAHLPPFASVVGPVRAFAAGATFGVLGQGFLKNGVTVTVGGGAANFSAVSDTFMTVFAPGGCTGPVVVSEPGATLAMPAVTLTTPQVVSVGNATIAKFQVCGSILRRPPQLVPH